MPLKDIDWDAEWKRAQAGRTVALESTFWDKKASNFHTGDATDYQLKFLSYAGIEEGWSVLDVGAGTGVLSLPLAAEGHQVTALDFSPGMLAKLKEEAQLSGVKNLITCIQGSWEDNWQTLGIEPEGVDVAIASRSFLTAELMASLRQLTAAARKRVCMTVGVAAFPFYDMKLMQTIGLGEAAAGDYFYILGALADMGILAELRFIGSRRRDVYLDKASAKDAVLYSLGSVSAEVEDRLGRYLDEHLIPWKLTAKEHETLVRRYGEKDIRVPATARGDAEDTEYQGVAKDYLRDTRWAFISWNKEE